MKTNVILNSLTVYETQILDVLYLCSQGTFKEINPEHSHKLCLIHLDKRSCEILGMKFISLLKCKVKTITIMDEGLTLHLTIEVPNKYSTPHTIYQINTVPIFVQKDDNIFVSEIEGLQGLTLIEMNGQSLDPIILEPCELKHGIKLCRPFELRRPELTDCVSSVVRNQNIAGTCKFTSWPFKSTDCYAQAIPHGIAISSKNEIDIHSTNEDALFHSKSKTKSGVFVINDNLNTTYTVSCNSVLLSTLGIGNTSHEVVFSDALTHNVEFHQNVNMDLHSLKADLSEYNNSFLDLSRDLDKLNSSTNIQWNVAKWNNKYTHPGAIVLSVVLYFIIIVTFLAITYCLFRRYKKPSINIVDADPFTRMLNTTNRDHNLYSVPPVSSKL